MKIQEIQGKMISTWEADVNAILDTWTNYHVTLNEFNKAVLIRALDFSTTHGGIAWIVDSSKAKGEFSDEIQQFIASDVFQIFSYHGIRFFITIKPNVYGPTSMAVRSYSAHAGPAGIQLIDLKSVADAKMWLKEHSVN